MERETSRSATQHNPENMFGEGVPVVRGCLERTIIEAEEARETKEVFTMVVGACVCVCVCVCVCWMCWETLITTRVVFKTKGQIDREIKTICLSAPEIEAVLTEYGIPQYAWWEQWLVVLLYSNKKITWKHEKYTVHVHIHTWAVGRTDTELLLIITYSWKYWWSFVRFTPGDWRDLAHAPHSILRHHEHCPHTYLWAIPSSHWSTWTKPRV